MKPNRLTFAHFSPAGHTKTAMTALLSSWRLPVRELDLSLPQVDSLHCEADELCLLGVPSYGGRIPAVAAQRMHCLKGENTPVILLVSYGNRHFDDTLLEMQDIMEPQGFVTIAGITAIAEHTICPHYATGRPSAEDCRQLEAFSLAIRQKLEQEGVHRVAMPGNHPYRSFGGMPVHPQPTDDCTRCGICASQCPVQAIDSKTFLAAPASCITCMRCVYICPQKARTLPPPFLAAVSQKLAPACTQSHPNQLFC